MIFDEADFAGAPYHFNPGDLIVAEEHVGYVSTVLREAGVPIAAQVGSDLLGLAKLTLGDLDRAPDLVLTFVRGEGVTEGDLPSSRLDEADTGLDRILMCLRALSSRRYGGWMPTMGKNRLVTRVRTSKAISTGGADDLRPEKAISTGGTAGPESTSGRWPDADLTVAARRRDVRIGVLDTGLVDHRWFAGRCAVRYSDLLHSEAPPVAEGHGTFVTGLVLHGAPTATVVHRRGLPESDGTGDSWSVAEAIVRLGQADIDILNLSLVCYTGDGQPPLALATAIDRLDPEIVVVAAAGNHAHASDEDEDAAVGTDGAQQEPQSGQSPARSAVRFRDVPAWPAALDDVIAVGATAADGSVAEFSPDKPWVDVYEVGVDVLSTFPHHVRDGDGHDDFGGWATWSGTSFAAARITGAIAASMASSGCSAREAARDLLSVGGRRGGLRPRRSKVAEAG